MAKWDVSWHLMNHSEMDAGECITVYDGCWCTVMCSECTWRSLDTPWHKRTSENSFEYQRQLSDLRQAKTKYCPHCGAKMEGV